MRKRTAFIAIITLQMNAPYLDPDDVAAARARLALTNDDLAVLARLRICKHVPHSNDVEYRSGTYCQSAGFLMNHLLNGETQ